MKLLRAMNSVEFEIYIDKAINYYAKIKMEMENLNEVEALKQALAEYQDILPYGEKTKDQYLFSIVKHKTPIGSVWLRKKNETLGVIYDLRVDEEFQGKGYAKLAVQELEFFAHSLGLKEMKLQIFDMNKKIINLYESVGFNQEHKIWTKKIKIGNDSLTRFWY